MNKKCPNCNVVNFINAERCVRCQIALEIVKAEIKQKAAGREAQPSLSAKIFKRAAGCVIVCIVVIFGFYLSLLLTSKSLAYDEKQSVKDQNIKTLDALYEAMKGAGVKPDEFRESMRKQYTRDAVFQNEVDRRVYNLWSTKEIKDYYEQHKDKFTKPETVTLSEIFLGFAGKDEKAVRNKADQLIADLRKGADFVKTALENSDAPDVAQTKGSVGTFPAKDLTDKVAATIKSVKAGDVAKLESEEGIEIIRVDARENASSEAVFNENAVRTAMTYEKLPEERKKYLAGLRKDAYIKISESYKAMVLPFLPVGENKTEAKKTK